MPCTSDGKAYTGPPHTRDPQMFGCGAGQTALLKNTEHWGMRFFIVNFYKWTYPLR